MIERNLTLSSLSMSMRKILSMLSLETGKKNQCTEKKADVVFSILDAREFEWESQLRFYWVNEPDELMIRQCTGEFGYGYEYMGLNGRLVITPLTDRIYLTITQVR